MADDIIRVKNPNRMKSYFKLEWWTLTVISFSGIIYNIGMTAGPWFEGKLAQCLADIMDGKKTIQDMMLLAAIYVMVILLVQGMRYIKRLYVRKFANHVNRNMKEVLYRSLVHKEKSELESESVGALMTKAISDVDTCVEGMRKFTTEIFDTGVVMAAYLVMLLWYDWRLALISLLFPPIGYVIAGKLKRVVTRSAAQYKESAGRLNGATFDRVVNAVTYRVYGQEKKRDGDYEECLMDYERRAVRANIWETSMQPLYQIISMAGAVFILWFGAKNVLGNGWAVWDIAAFTTFLSCFTKLAAKSSKAAKLFNAVQKAQVSWKRIKPLLNEVPKEGAPEEQEEKDIRSGKTEELRIEEQKRGQKKQKELQIEEQKRGQKKPVFLRAAGVSFSYPGRGDADENAVFQDLTFTANPGDVIGVTGPVACGKSTLGRVFLCEYPYGGRIQVNGKELKKELKKELSRSMIGYMGHQPELLSDTIRENILLGTDADASIYLKGVCMGEEVREMPEGMETVIGNAGVRLSGGQQARIALARTLCQKRPVMILDDPFSAVDQKTEKQIMANIRELAADSILIILSHRLTLFPEFQQVFWMKDGQITVSDHHRLMQENAEYAYLYRTQTGGDSGEER